MRPEELISGMLIEHNRYQRQLLFVEDWYGGTFVFRVAGEAYEGWDFLSESDLLNYHILYIDLENK